MKTTNFRLIVIDILQRRDGPNCSICHLEIPNDDSEVDHIVPRNYGGGDTISNLQLVHSKCNRDKGANFILGFCAKTFLTAVDKEKGKEIPLLRQLRLLAVDEALRIGQNKIKNAAKILGVDLKTLYRWRSERDKFARSGIFARSDIPIDNQIDSSPSDENPQ